MHSVSLVGGLKVLRQLMSNFVHSRRLAIPVPIPTEFLAILDQIANRSYAVLPGHIERETCDRMRVQIDNLIEQYPDCTQVDKFGADHRMYGSENGSKDIMSFHTDNIAIAIGSAYCKRHLVNFSTLAARLEAVPENLGSGQGWHRDAVPRQFKAIAYLSDVTAENGPFQILPGSHRPHRKIADTALGFLDPDSTRISDEAIENLRNGRAVQIDSIIGEAGTIILVDTSAIHRGMPIKQGVRYALTNYYYLPEEITGRDVQFAPMLTPSRIDRH